MAVGSNWIFTLNIPIELYCSVNSQISLLDFLKKILKHIALKFVKISKFTTINYNLKSTTPKMRLRYEKFSARQFKRNY